MNARRLAFALGLVAPLIARPAFADNVKEACAHSSEQAQLLRIQNQPTRAKAELLKCAQASCPLVVQHDCSVWLTELQPGIPTVVLDVQDESGHDLFDVTVLVDGVVVTRKLDGAEIELDPGPHTLAFDATGRTHAEEKLLVRAGEKRRSVLVHLAPSTTATPVASAPKNVPTQDHAQDQSTHGNGRKIATYVVGGVGVVGIGSFAFFAIESKNRFDSLQSSCGHNCSSSDVSGVKTTAAIADVSLGVGIVALSIATYLFLTEPKAPERSAWIPGVIQF